MEVLKAQLGAPRLVSSFPAPEDNDDRLQVGSTSGKCRDAWERSPLDVLPRPARRPCRVLPQVGGQDLHDRAVVLPRLTGNSLQGIDAPEPDIKFVAAELFDRPREPLRQLAGDLVRMLL